MIQHHHRACKPLLAGWVGVTDCSNDGRRQQDHMNGHTLGPDDASHPLGSGMFFFSIYSTKLTLLLSFFRFFPAITALSNHWPPMDASLTQHHHTAWEPLLAEGHGGADRQQQWRTLLVPTGTAITNNTNPCQSDYGHNQQQQQWCGAAATSPSSCSPLVTTTWWGWTTWMMDDYGQAGWRQQQWQAAMAGDGSNKYDGAGWQQLQTMKLNNSEQYFFLSYFCANGPPPSFAPFLCTTCKVGILFLVLLLLLL